MSSSNTPESSSEIFSFGSNRDTRSSDDPEKRKKGTNSAPYSRNRIGILSVFFSTIVGAFMLADNYERLNDRATANLLRLCFLVGSPALWFLLSLAALMSSFSSDTTLTVGGANLLSWFLPLLVLDVYYRRWRKQWIETNGEIVSGNGSGRALLYVGMAIAINVAFRVYAPNAIASIALKIISSAPPTTFVDGTFSMTYPTSWTAYELTTNPNCGQLGLDCVQVFDLPYTRGSVVVFRNSSLIERMVSLSVQEQYHWDNLPIPSKTSVKTFDTTFDGYEAFQRDFTYVDGSKSGEGALIVVRTNQDIYIIIAIGLGEDYDQVEKALATIQLDVE